MTKIISLVLAIVLLMSIIPGTMAVLADEPENEYINEIDLPEIENITEPPVGIALTLPALGGYLLVKTLLKIGIVATVGSATIQVGRNGLLAQINSNLKEFFGRNKLTAEEKQWRKEAVAEARRLEKYAKAVLKAENAAIKAANRIKPYTKPAIEVTHDDLERIAEKTLNFDCDKIAKNMRKLLIKNRQRGELIELRFSTMFLRESYVVSIDWPNKGISRTGYHCGIKYDELVHCNVYPAGLSEEIWINKFRDPSGNPPHVNRIPF